MTHTAKFTAVTALTLTAAFAAPLPAAASLTADLNSMTCADYNDLSEVDQNRIAVAAVMELNDTAATTIEDNNGVATATDPLIGEKEEESLSGEMTTLAEDNGTATATTTVPAGNDAPRYAEEIKILDLTCERNGDTMVLEAAAGQDGTR